MRSSTCTRASARLFTRLASRLELLFESGLVPRCRPYQLTCREQKIAALVRLWRGNRCAVRDSQLLSAFKEELQTGRLALWRLAGRSQPVSVFRPTAGVKVFAGSQAVWLGCGESLLFRFWNSILCRLIMRSSVLRSTPSTRDAACLLPPVNSNTRAT